MFSNYTIIAGVDEVGRGCFAGPVVAAAVIFRPGDEITEADDSKKITAARRNEIAEIIKTRALAYHIGMADIAEINKYNIAGASRLAMQRAVAGLSVQPEFMIVDYVKLEMGIPYIAPAKADATYKVVGAASIIAKVYRDELLDELSQEYPEYGLERNKGYGTPAHLDAIRRYGVRDIHRKAFVRNLLGEKGNKLF